MLRIPIFVLTCVLSALPASGQALVDTSFTWQSYLQRGRCHLQIYRAPPDEERRPHVVVLHEAPENQGPALSSDARFVIEAVARSYRIPPDSAYWIVHVGPFSYRAGAGHERELFLRATVRRTDGQRLARPNWRIVTYEDLMDYTDRLFRRPRWTEAES